jgi:hypothetical protein
MRNNLHQCTVCKRHQLGDSDGAAALAVSAGPANVLATFKKQCGAACASFCLCASAASCFLHKSEKLPKISNIGTTNIYVLIYIQLCTALKVKCNPRKRCSSKFEPLLLEHLQQHGMHQPVAHLLRCCLAALVRKLYVMLQEAKKRSFRQSCKL